MGRLLTVPLLLLTLAGAGPLAGERLEQFRPHDFSFSATVPGNPFDVELWGDFTGPGGARLRVPGFYDGGGVWKVRFSPVVTGAWSLRTVSPVPALDGKAVKIEAVAGTNPAVHGRLRIDPEHPYHFVFEDGTRFFLMGYEADWLGLADMKDPKRKLMRSLIDQIHARGFNYVLVNVYAHDTRWCPGHVNQWDHGPPALFAWEGTNDRPDHSRLNPSFFQVYDTMMWALYEKGIIAHMMLKVYNKYVNWPPAGSQDEARYFRYVVARYQAFPNLVWDYSKESFKEPDNALQKNLIDLVRNSDAYRLLVTAHDDDEYEWDPRLNGNLDFRIDQQHSHWPEMIAFDRRHRRRPVVNAEFSYELGVEPLPTHTNRNQVDWKEMLRRAYWIHMAGGYTAYYYNNTAWDIIKPDPEPPGHPRWQQLKQVLTSLPYWRMDPAPDLAVGGPGLAELGSHYIYYVEGPDIVLNLTGLSGEAAAEWINTWNGDRLAAGAVTAGVRRFEKPAGFADAPGLIVVRRR